MLSVILLSPDLFASQIAQSPAANRARREAIVRTLGALVPLAVEGLVRDVAIAGRSEESLADIADHAGCGLFEAGLPGEALGQAARAARFEHLFLIKAGIAPEAGFADELVDLEVALHSEQTRPCIYYLRAAPYSLLTRIFPALSDIAGVILQRSRVESSALTSFGTMCRQRGAKRNLVSRARKTASSF